MMVAVADTTGMQAAVPGRIVRAWQQLVGLAGSDDTSWSGRVRPHVLVMTVIFAGALVIGALILPGEDERIAALERDGQTRRALQLLEARFERGDRRQRTLFQLQRIYEFHGDNDKSRRVLELLAAQRPRDALIQRELAQLYKAIQDEPAYIRALRAQLALKYAEPACRELIGLMRRNSNYAEEQQALVDCRARGYRRPNDLVRLAFLEASDGRLAETAQILAAVDDRRWLGNGRERLMLYAALIETQQFPEALRRGVRWLRGQPDTDLALEFVYKLVEADRNDLAIQLARQVGKPGDAVALAVGEIMVDQVQYAAARAFLNGWLEQAKLLSLEVAIRFVTAALDAEDPLLALRGAEIYGLDKLEQAEIVAIAEALAGANRNEEFDRVRGRIQPEQIALNPLLAGAIELRLGRLEVARVFLSQVRRDELDERRLGFFQQLAAQAGRPPTQASMVREPPPEAVVATAPNQALGPAQAQAKQRILKRAESNRRLRDRRAQQQKKAVEREAKAQPQSQPQSQSQSAPAGGFFQFPAPSPPPFTIPSPQ